jgi:hypothetical protein
MVLTEWNDAPRLQRGCRLERSLTVVPYIASLVTHHALRHSQNLGDNEDDPENLSSTVRLTIRIPSRRLCTLCRPVHVVLDLILTDQRGVDHAKGGNGALAVSR